MFYKAFKQYVQHKLKKKYEDSYDLLEGFMFGVIAVSLAQPWLIETNEWLLTTNLIVPAYVVVLSTFAFIWPVIRIGLGALRYACRFYGDYEVIDMAFGYRAFRVTPTQQEYHGLYYEKRPRKKELIIASAIIDGTGTIWCVEKPGRHHHCIWYMAQYGANKQEHTQGFLTNQYRFVGREYGRLLALETGQVRKTDHAEELFSEDLWDTPEHLRYKG